MILWTASLTALIYNAAHGTSVCARLGQGIQNGSFTRQNRRSALARWVRRSSLPAGADIIMPVAGPRGLGAAAAAKADGNTRTSAWTDCTRQKPD